MKKSFAQDEAQKNNTKASWDKQAHAPRKGVKAQDQDEYDAKGTGKKYVPKHDAYKEQDKAPQGRGNRGPSQLDGGPIEGWNVSVKEHGAYDSQHHAPAKGSSKVDSSSLGFKLSENADYLGHFKEEKYHRMGHNDGPSWGQIGEATGDANSAEMAARKDAELPDPDPKVGQKPLDDEEYSGRKSAQDSMRKAFKYK